MKRTAFAAFVAFWTAVGTLVAVNALSSSSGSDGDQLRSLSLEEIAAHNTEQDCWMVIEGKVYDLTDYLPKHPTPAAILIPWCGGEATEGMRTKGYGRDHSPAAWEMLDAYQIGIVSEE